MPAKVKVTKETVSYINLRLPTHEKEDISGGAASVEKKKNQSLVPKKVPARTD